MGSYVCKSLLPSSSILSILVVGYFFNCLLIQHTFRCLLCAQLWAGRCRHREDLGGSSYSMLVAERESQGQCGECTL